MSEEAVEIAERLDDVDGDIEKLEEEEQQAFSLLTKAINGMFEGVDLEQEQQNDYTGRAFQ